MKFLILILICLVVGCVEDGVYDGNVEFHKINGKVHSVTVTMPKSTTSSITLDTRAEVESFEIQLESMLKDIRYAKEQMPYDEAISE